eukprot:TRINITY_DN15300_c0_g1_i1.p3 TRINITY_DN15300_c0_g1~~TRINITY_DN15300_c0_g1_i1.p3  ORF type:complete len:104 (+),score=19.80 TRINITY_DN15300_c0_g1_i1:63-374(+)
MCIRDRWYQRRVHGDIYQLKKEEIEKIKTKLSYKMPVTFRYSITLGFLTGFIHGAFTKRVRPILFHILGVGIGGGLGLCLYDFKAILENKKFCSDYEKQIQKQ